MPVSYCCCCFVCRLLEDPRGKKPTQMEFVTQTGDCRDWEAPATADPANDKELHFCGHRMNWQSSHTCRWWDSWSTHDTGLDFTAFCHNLTGIHLQNVVSCFSANCIILLRHENTSKAWLEFFSACSENCLDRRELYFHFHGKGLSPESWRQKSSLQMKQTQRISKSRNRSCKSFTFIDSSFPQLSADFSIAREALSGVNGSMWAWASDLWSQGRPRDQYHSISFNNIFGNWNVIIVILKRTNTMIE